MTTAVILLSDDRSFPHRMVSNFHAQLRVKDLELERLQIFTVLTGEVAVANRIVELESCVLFSQPDQDTSFDERILASLLSSSSESSSSVAAAAADLFRFCLHMQISYNQAQGAVQERMVALLRHHIVTRPESKSALVNYGALVGAVQSMRQFPRRPRLQRDATAFLLHSMTVHTVHTESTFYHDDGTGNENDGNNREILDRGILRFMEERGGFALILQAIEWNRYEVNFFNNGEIQNYARRMASSQIPDVIRFIQSSCHQGDSLSDVTLPTLENKVRFLKMSFATLLDDSGISQTTCMSSVPSF